MIDGTIVVNTGSGPRTVQLASYLDAAAEEGAHADEYAWIKQLRHAQVDGAPFRQRFTVRGDSLWWFSEIYLHKMRAVLDVHRVVAATNVLIERERPLELHVASGSVIVRDVVPQLAELRRVRTAGGRVSTMEWIARLAGLEWRARGLTLAAFASRLKTASPPRVPPPSVTAFIHRAFWRAGTDDGSAEAYIGPVLKTLEERAGEDAIKYVAIGPSSNFRARRWWDPLAPDERTRTVVPIERYAPWEAMTASRAVWRARHRHMRAMATSADLRSASRISGVDCWPLVREQLAGIAWLQWPWSARAMDEAGAALDALKPKAVLTYAEAGGWGRALILEARRRDISSVGLQHGFIYRQWLNYRHEPDEMEPASVGDRGFPVPTLTLAFDDYAASHLRQHGRFPSQSVRVTGSPKLDALMEQLHTLAADAIDNARREAGVPHGHSLVLVTTKEREARDVLPGLIEAAATLPDVSVVIKPHPAETEAAYAAVAAGRPHVRVVSPNMPLAPLLAASRALVTVNSTVALDAAVAGIPALVVGLPNNLSPFVERAALAGATTTAEIRTVLQRILYDEGFRQQLAASRGAFLDEYAIRSDGAAAARAAAAVLELVRRKEND